ncbi:MAG: cyclic nucleotide-binding domain-containing protein [Leptospira sp.]|nr:cyclic nucleotide-binding domain-containing protein [Leptospira sp.]
MFNQKLDEDHEQYLTISDIFKKLPRKFIKEILEHTTREFLPSGKILFRQGDPGEELFIVTVGRLRYEIHNSEGNLLDSGEFQRADILGELSIFTGEARSATVRAIRESEILRIPRKVIIDIFMKEPQALLEVTSTISHRLMHARSKDEIKATKVFSFSVFPTRKDTSTKAFLEYIYDLVSNIDNVQIVTKEDFDKAFPDYSNKKTDNLEHEVILWFQEIENNNKFIIYKGDFEDNEWSERCYHQSDRVLFLQDSTKAPNVSELEQALKNKSHFTDSVDLVILHPTIRELPRNTKSHLQIRSVSRYYHIALDNQLSVERFVRRLIGESLGLAFGGGGAKGFAHIGAIRAIEEAHGTIDLVSGTSAGSVFAALYAMGYDSYKTESIAKSIWVDRNLLNEYTIPIISLVSGKKYTETIKEFFGDIMIEDLWIPYSAIATDLTNAKLKIYNSGYLWKAIRASTSLPGIVPPFIEDDIVYVDGGLLDNVPGLVLKSEGAGRTICIDVFGDSVQEGDKHIASYFDEGSQGILNNPLSLVGNWLKFDQFFQPKFPAIGEILIRSMLVASREKKQATQHDAALYVTIPTHNYGVLDWNKFEFLIKEGYSKMKKEIADSKIFSL